MAACAVPTGAVVTPGPAAKRYSAGWGTRGPEPPPPGPWANFGGWGWPRRFLCLGGRVHGEGISQVRLVDALGRIVEDIVDEGMALILRNAPLDMPPESSCAMLVAHFFLANPGHRNRAGDPGRTSGTRCDV